MNVAGAHQRAMQVEALKALVNLVEVDEPTFRLLLRSHEKPTLVAGTTGFLWFRKHVYMTSYDGFVFLHRPEREIDLLPEAPDAVVVRAKSVHIPFL
ncbi:MAG: hypothetical protein L6Q95_07575 [Planctomycetes bacterium]|nr:hypothetical protein [Planctomycetota bacterium]